MFITISPWQSLIHTAAVQGLTFVNEYILVQTIGRGSFGKVKLALNTQDQNLYALKLIPKSRRRQQRVSAAARFAKPVVTEDEVQQEINVMKSLVHPNVVRLDEVIGEPLPRLEFVS